MAYSAKLGSPSQDRPPRPIAAENRLMTPILSISSTCQISADHHQADHVRQEEHGPEQAGEAAAPVHQQGEAQPGDIEAGTSSDDIEQA